LLEEVWHSDGRSGRAGFRAASIPASPHTTAAAVATLRALNLGGADSLEETALLIATTALAHTAASASLWADARDRVSCTERRKIAQALRALEEKRKEKSNWWNQMPIASGLVSSIDDRRRAIDLVHRHDRSGKRYDFVELKIDSDTPLFALMEILRYGNVYLVLRESRDWLPEVSRALPVFNAEHVGLRVLAPKIYYGNLNLYWLQEKINLALPQIIKEYPYDLTLTMDISSHWPTQLEEWDETILSNDSRLLSLLNKWNPAYLQ